MIHTHNKMFDEHLQDVKTVEELASIIKNMHYARVYIEQAVNDKFINFDTSDITLGQPNNDRWQAGAYLLSRPTSNIFNLVFLTEKTSKNLKHKQFKALMEMLYVGEARILEACLNKNLESVFPTLTHTFICEALNIADDRITAS
jgi:hypothetical protein